jgi:murein DD-endopeptidase MepM/ murein hydrolase activator NlpD
MKKPLTQPRVTSPYGWRKLNGQEQFHHGIDYIDAEGDHTVFAIADGVVVFDHDNYKESERWNMASNSSIGNFVIVKHTIDGKDYFVRYCHLTENCVKDKQPVKAGEKLGEYGDVGVSYGEHLHVDVTTRFGRWGEINPASIGL